MKQYRLFWIDVELWETITISQKSAYKSFHRKENNLYQVAKYELQKQDIN